ncbi:hypothetical protein TKK_0008599 [Trichogramma kaykai]
MLMASSDSILTISGTIDTLTEYDLSEANSVSCDGYITDHTDLVSDIDESELRRELLTDKWRLLFDKYDPEGFGEIPIEDFLVALKSSEWQKKIPINKLDLLYTRAKEFHVNAVTFQDFVNVYKKSSKKINEAEGYHLAPSAVSRASYIVEEGWNSLDD